MGGFTPGVVQGQAPALSHSDDRAAALERDGVVGLGAGGKDRGVRSGFTEPLRVFAAKRKSAMDEVQFWQAIIDACNDLWDGERVNLFESFTAQIVVNGATIVWVDEREVPELCALVEVGRTPGAVYFISVWVRELSQPRVADAGNEIFDISDKGGVGQCRAQ